MPNPQIPLNCPHCGRPMRVVDSDEDPGATGVDSLTAAGVYIRECAVHGRFHLGPGRDLTPGMPETT